MTGLCKSEPEPAINDTKSDGDTANPDMGVRPRGAAAKTLITKVMDPAKGGLKEEDYEYDYANDWVCIYSGNRKLVSTCKPFYLV